jgi:hypothetical protein
MTKDRDFFLELYDVRPSTKGRFRTFVILAALGEGDVPKAVLLVTVVLSCGIFPMDLLILHKSDSAHTFSYRVLKHA